jgi:hypothetical protein
MNAIDFDTFQTITSEQLANVSGGFDVNRMIDNANRWGNSGALVGGGVGTVAGGVADGVAGSAAGGVGAGLGGGIGWLDGAISDTWNQLRGN